MATQGLPLLLLFGGLGYLRWKHRLANDPRLVRSLAAQRAIQVQLAAMDTAMQNRKAEDFFNAARRALQQRLGARWNLPSESVTMHEVSSRMESESETLRPLFEMADHASYSGQALDEADFRHWKDASQRSVIAGLKTNHEIPDFVWPWPPSSSRSPRRCVPRTRPSTMPTAPSRKVAMPPASRTSNPRLPGRVLRRRCFAIWPMPSYAMENSARLFSIMSALSGFPRRSRTLPQI